MSSYVAFQDLKSSGARDEVASKFCVIAMLILPSDIEQYAVGLLYNCILFVPSFVKIGQGVWIYTRNTKNLILPILKGTVG